MHNILLAEFFILYFMMAAVTVICLIQQIIALVNHKKSDVGSG